MDYKKILKNPASRQKVLNFFNFIPDEPMLKLQYRIKNKRRLNLKNPECFTEKLQWYKLNYRNPVMKTCVDKYTVRKYVAGKGLSGILNECYGIYNSCENVDFAKLPEKFVLKKTNGGGGLNVLICRNRETFNIDEAKRNMNRWLKEPEISGGREWAYTGLKARIIAEKYLENNKNPEAGINDYKIFCYGGKPKYIIVDVDRYIGHKRNFYDVEWNNLKVGSDCPASDREIDKPENLDDMLNVASKLSEDFPYVRVDLYSVAGKIYFGELTFYPWSGYVQFTPDEWDYKFGEDFELIAFPENRGYKL